jgi:hypothetical protein
MRDHRPTPHVQLVRHFVPPDLCKLDGIDFEASLDAVEKVQEDQLAIARFLIREHGLQDVYFEGSKCTPNGPAIGAAASRATSSSRICTAPISPLCSSRRDTDHEGLLAPMTPRGFVHAAERRFYAPRGVPGGCPATKPSCKALDDVLSAQPSYPAAGH